MGSLGTRLGLAHVHLDPCGVTIRSVTHARAPRCCLKRHKRTALAIIPYFSMVKSTTVDQLPQILGYSQAKFNVGIITSSPYLIGHTTAGLTRSKWVYIGSGPTETLPRVWLVRLAFYCPACCFRGGWTQ